MNTQAKVFPFLSVLGLITLLLILNISDHSNLIAQDPPLIPMPGTTPTPMTGDSELTPLPQDGLSTEPVVPSGAKAIVPAAAIPANTNVVNNTELHTLSGWILSPNSGSSWSIALQDYPLGDYTTNKVMLVSGSSGEAYIAHNINYSSPSNTPLEYLVDLRVVSGNPTIRLVIWPENHNQTLVCAFTPGVRAYMQTYGCRGRTNAWSNIQVQIQVIGNGTIWADNAVLRAYPTYPALSALPTPGQSGWSLSPASGTSWTFGSGHYRAFAGWRNTHLIDPRYFPDGNGGNGLWWKINGNDPAFEVPLAGVRVGNFTHVEVDMGLDVRGTCLLELYFQTDTFDYYSENRNYNSEVSLTLSGPAEGTYYFAIPQSLRDNNALITSLRFDPCGRNNPSASDAVRIDRVGFVTRSNSNIQLLRNLSFEDDLNPADGLADFWGIRGGTGERRLCQTGVARTGSCAFEFQGSGLTEDSILQQRVDLVGKTFSVGDVLSLRGYARATGAPNLRIQIIVNYSNGTSQRAQVRYNTANASYTQLLDPSTGQPLRMTLTRDDVVQIRVLLWNRNSTGNAYFDDFSLIQNP